MYTLCSHEYVSHVLRDHLRSMSDMVHPLHPLGYRQKHSRVWANVPTYAKIVCFYTWGHNIPTSTYTASGPGSSVSIATGYGLDSLGIESWWGGGGLRFFSAPVQTSPGADPAFCTMGTGSFLGVKSGRGVTLTPHPHPVPWS